jgi:hypothetical protein
MTLRKKKCDEMGQEFLWSDNDKHSTTRCSKQARKTWYHYYLYVCVYLDIVSHCFPSTSHCFLYLFM